MSQLCILSVVLVAVGLYGVLLKRNLVKVVLGIELMVIGVAGLVVVVGSGGSSVAEVSQTIGLIAVVGGASVVCLMIVTAVRLYEKYGTLDIREMRRLKG
ncbi:MAG: NADH-quinone oxidoreductase subunit K [Dehalococcoidia bacterium]|nr:NADH-quinone oxidoreductase subunit K [Dehalococcoidia bacterium]